MPARLFPYAFLPLLGAVWISASAGQDLRYYQDLIPEPSSEDITLQYLTRVLKARNQNGAYGPVFFPPHHLKEHEANKQWREQKRVKEFPAVHRESIYPLSEKSVDISRKLIERSLLNILSRNDQIYTPSRYNSHLAELQQPPLQNLEYHNPENWYPDRNSAATENGMKEEPSADIHHRYLTIERQNADKHSFHGQHSGIAEEKHRDFTYELPKPISPREKDHWVPFSGPGEPEFDMDREMSTRFTEAGSGLGSEDITEQITQMDDADAESNLDHRAELPKQLKPFYSLPKSEVIFNKNKNDFDEDMFDVSTESSAEILPGFQRRAESHGPIVTSVDHSIGKDIYLIAVVAGCSAAAMFVLVLISLTWCRFQRGAKAAADVEYPAYGVTGPNKDTSPSGDRRLAQSAQMYHYQHQKQQIIAMESRTATGRDPGSVSEAESDEENEEGDYTVYECPGLAPTGEMEVKNPLFHDDPTPATPAGPGQSSRSSEDQNM